MKRKVYIYSFILLLIDIVSKLLIKSNILLNQSIKVIPNFFNLTYVLNDGAAFSILRGRQYLLIILGILIFMGIIYSIKKENLNKFKIIYYSLLIGGLLGNLIDRIIYNGVIDFFDFKIFGIEMPIFNLADTFICISVGLILIEGISGYGNKSK